MTFLRPLHIRAKVSFLEKFRYFWQATNVNKSERDSSLRIKVSLPL